LVKANNTLFYYDAAGNLIKKNSPEKESIYEYDAENKLIAYSNGKDKVTFEYDGEGRRISKTVTGNKIIFINNPTARISKVLAETDSKGKTQKRYVYALTRLCQQSTDGTSFFLYERPSKSVALLADEKGSLIESYTYDAFGFQEGKKNSNNNYRYNAEEYDEETGLIFLRNRYYDPEIGRFISIDSTLPALSDPKELNTYPFAGNDPINHCDPTGFGNGESD
jgi:RHS repeat-associated protein